ncbi:hypothetical protein LVY72_06115 [Arthrobacter sp. I2-34]|uniref:Uncharacterized protein n=1 Tax=Arthrobacter hankyongi TaxID=2904801 RepID=A0ABS9L4A8_9MICC|nr:hypothetical protein [Arthrobacter hankyongi]MCG2621491.1 hypothetical protein [Arthrobacter hankyongi]
MAFTWPLLRRGAARRTGSGAAGSGTAETRRLIRSLERTYPGSRAEATSTDKVRLVLPGGDVLTFYVNR